MSLISCDGVAIAHGANTVLDGLDLRIERRDRLAVVGSNGAGKSSLLDVLAGLLPPSAGDVAVERGTRTAYLPQDTPEPAAATVLEEVMAARQDLSELHAAMRLLEERMAAGDAAPALLAEYGDAQHRYDVLGGYDLEARSREALGGLGLDAELQQRHPSQLSGGQQRRVEMAKLLVQDADLLLLDEPTNHLDLAAIEWLEGFFAPLPVALVLVSHDRRFIDSVCTRVLELSGGRAEDYPGNYTQYVRLRGERRERRRKEFEAQQAHISHQEDFIRRYKAGQRAREARGRQKQLDRLERVAAPVEEQRPRLRFTPAPASNVLLRVERLVAGRDAPLATLESCTITRHDRIAIVGPNGSGKSTLLHTLAGELPPLSGRVVPGARLAMRLYRQDLARGDAAMETRTVLEALLARQPIGEERARTLLGALLFSGDDVMKPVAELSGGERARLLMGGLALDPVNLLLLDEPTNHLDIPAQEVLEDALQQFPGAVVLVSHDRALIDAVATRTWAIEDGRVREVLGGYTDLLRARARGPLPAPAPPVAERRRDAGSSPAASAPATAAGAKPTPASGGAAPRDRARSRRESAAERQARAEARRLEQEIEDLEREVQRARDRLADPQTFADPFRGAEAGREHDRLAADLDRLYERWTTAQDGG